MVGRSLKRQTDCLRMQIFIFLFFFIRFSRRLMEEDDGALSEIEPDSVPNEVRDWLAMTFTRSMSTIKRRPSDKPKFKSVAQAIRAGIMVDRFVIETKEMRKDHLKVQIDYQCDSIDTFHLCQGCKRLVSSCKVQGMIFHGDNESM